MSENPLDHGAMFLAYEETVRALLRNISDTGLRWLAADLRLGGRWMGLVPELDARRQLLLADVAERIEAMGLAASPGDLLPTAPDTAEGL